MTLAHFAIACLRQSYRLTLSLLAIAIGALMAHAQLMINKGATIVTKPNSIVIVKGSYQNSTGSIDDSGVVTVTSDFTNNTPATAGGAGYYYIAGNFTNDGVFDQQTGTVVLNGTSNQNVGGFTITTFYNLQFTNGGSKTLTQKEFVDSNCYFTNGVCYTTDQNVLSFTLNGEWVNNAGLPTSSASSYVSGPCEKDLNSTALWIFPVGKDGRANTCGIRPNSSNETTFRTEYFDFPYVNTVDMQSPLVVVSKIHYWHGDIVSSPGAPAPAIIRLYWIPGDYTNASYMNSISNLVVARWDTEAPAVPGPTPAWVTAGVSNVSGDYTSGWIQSTKVLAADYGTATLHRPFTIASITADNTLPVEMGPFDVQEVKNHVELEWNTFSEFQNLGFEIERRRVGESPVQIKSFETDPNLLAKSAFGAFYTTEDDDELSDGDYIYELFQVDVNGTRTRAGSRQITYARTAIAKSSLAVFPNPAASQNVKLNIQLPVSEFVSVRFADVTGKIVLTALEQPLAAGSHILPIDISRLSSGAYNIIFEHGADNTQTSQRTTQLFIVQR